MRSRKSTAIDIGGNLAYLVHFGELCNDVDRNVASQCTGSADQQRDPSAVRQLRKVLVRTIAKSSVHELSSPLRITARECRVGYRAAR